VFVPREPVTPSHGYEHEPTVKEDKGDRGIGQDAVKRLVRDHAPALLTMVFLTLSLRRSA
jgi:hypothetical protein